MSENDTFDGYLHLKIIELINSKITSNALSQILRKRKRKGRHSLIC